MEEAEKKNLGHVVMVDDDPEALKLWRIVLNADFAYKSLRECGDGNTAVEFCRDRATDLLLLDMMLPKRSGILVADAVSKLPVKPFIVMITANEGRRHKEYVERLGVDAYLLKPFRVERLVEILNKYVKYREELGLRRI